MLDFLQVGDSAPDEDCGNLGISVTMLYDDSVDSSYFKIVGASIAGENNSLCVSYHSESRCLKSLGHAHANCNDTKTVRG